MSFPLSANGWEAPPTTNVDGIAIDAHDLIITSKMVQNFYTQYYGCDLISGKIFNYHDTSLGPMENILTGPPTGRGHMTSTSRIVAWSTNSQEFGRIMASSAQLTMRGFVETTNEDRRGLRFFVLSNVTLVSGSLKTIALCWNSTDIIITQGSPNRETDLLIVSGVPVGWHYFNMQKDGSRITLFIDGVQRGQVDIPGTQESSFWACPLMNANAGGGGKKFNFLELGLSDVIRDGLHVPTY